MPDLSRNLSANCPALPLFQLCGIPLRGEDSRIRCEKSADRHLVIDLAGFASGLGKDKLLPLPPTSLDTLESLPYGYGIARVLH